MAQGDDVQTTSNTPNGQRVQNSLHFKGSKPQTSPTFQQLLQSDGSKWSHISSQIKKKNDQEADVNRHNKKSVLAKVKETAKKLKLSLRRKKHGDKDESLRPADRSSGVGSKDNWEEDVEYHSARMYESKHTPATNKQVSISRNHSEKLNPKQSKDEHASFSNTTDPSTADAADTNTTNQTSTTIDVPKVHEFPEKISRFSSLMVSTPDSSKNKSDTRSKEAEKNSKFESQTPDKGVSVKEYLLHKFEPGEDERALSKVITQAISPRRDKVRDAMSSFLKNEEYCDQVNSNSSNDDNNVNLNFKSKSLPAASTNLNTNNTGSNIKQSYSLGSNASKASMNLNQTFRSTFASYQDHFLSSSSNHNNLMSSNWSLGHANETQAPGSSVKKTRVPSHTATSVRRVPVSRAKQAQVPSHITETNTIQVRPSTRTDCNATRTGVSTADQGRFRV